MAGRPLVVPTIFTAVDRLSGVIDRMKRSVGGFAGKASIGINALNRGFNSLIPSIGKMAQQFLSFAASAALFGGIALSADSILHYEKNLAQLHGLLNNLTDNAFVPYRKEVDRVATSTRYAAKDVADAFTKIAERNIALAKTPESLGSVTEAAITLSRAAKMELVPATEALVNVLYQFGLAGKDSNRVINVLAAGMKYGSSNIENQIEAYKKFAVTARGANMTLEQSNALIQTVAHQVQGSDAGTALRNIILNLQRYKEVYKDGKFDMSYALNKTAAQFKKLGTEQKQNIFLQDLFGKRQVNVARQLLSNIPLYEDLTKQITGTNEAQKIATQNTNNVIDRWDQLKNTFLNYLTSNDQTLKGLNNLKEFIGYVTDNMDVFIDRSVTLIKWLLGIKAGLWAVRAALAAYNIYIGVAGALTGLSNIAIGESGIALGAYRTAMLLATAATWLFNAALAVNPIVWVVAAIIAGVLAIIYIITYWSEITKWFGKQWDSFCKDAVSSWETIKNAFTKFSWKGFFVGLGNLILNYLLAPLKSVLYLASLLPGKVGDNAKKVYDAMGGSDSEINLFGSGDTDNKKPLLSAATQAIVNTNNNNTRNILDVNFNDPSGMVKNTASSGPIMIPVKVTSTTGNK